MVSSRKDRWPPERKRDSSLEGDQSSRMRWATPLTEIFSMVCRKRHQWPAVAVLEKYELKETLEGTI